MELAKTSNYVVYQEQTISLFPEPDASGKWDSDDGYMTIYTTAYHQGYVKSGNERYLIIAQVKFNNVFNKRNEDLLFMEHFSNAILDTEGTSEKCIMSYLHDFYSNVPGPDNFEETLKNEIKPNYSLDNGVSFALQWPKDKKISVEGYVIQETYKNWDGLAAYNIITTNDANVKISYIHNKKSLGGSLSVGLSYGPLGVSFNIEGDNGKYIPYAARPITVYNI